MEGNVPIRYDIDYHLVPEMFHYAPVLFISQLATRGEIFLADLFNDAYSRGTIGSDGTVTHHWRNSKPFTTDDFKILVAAFQDETRLIHVHLPTADDEGCDYCLAYIVVLDDETCRFYTVEKNIRNETYIGTVDENGVHFIVGGGMEYSEDQLASLHMFIHMLFHKEINHT